MNKKIRCLLRLLLIAFLGFGFANNCFALSLPNMPHVYLEGNGGYDGWTAIGKVDALEPVVLRSDRMVYIYGQGR